MNGMDRQMIMSNRWTDASDPYNTAHLGSDDDDNVVFHLARQTDLSAYVTRCEFSYGPHD